MKKYFLLGLLAFSFCFTNSQNKKTDSLLNLLKMDKEDTNRVNTLIEICKQNGLINDDKKEVYSKNALELSIKLNYKKGMIMSRVALAACNNNMGNYDKALKYINDALTIAIENPNDKRTLADIYNIIGISNYYKGDYASALPYFMKSAPLYEAIGKKGRVANVEYNMALIYFENKEYEKAADYTKKVIVIYEQLKENVMMANAFTQLGNIYVAVKNYEMALKYYNQSLEITETLDDKSYSLANLNGIGDILGNTKKYIEALVYHKKTLELAKATNDQRSLISAYQNIGIDCFQLGKLPEAIESVNQAADLSKKIKAKNLTNNAYLYLSKICEAQNKFKEALEYSRLYTSLHDSVYSEENAKQMNGLLAKYESEKKEKEIATLKLEQTVAEAQHKQKQLIYVSVVVLIIVIAFSLLNRQRLKTKNNEILFEKQEALLQAEKRKTEDELIHAKKLLNNYTENLIEKNIAIEELQFEIDKLKGLKAAELYKEKIDNLDDLNNATILTNEDWEKFKELFEQVYKGFFIRLKDKIPNLTNAETRLMALIKLNLDAKQMANMLGVSTNTITVTKYRLRKKLNLSDKQDIDILVESI